MYSDVFENDSNAGKKTVEYYKKVQKTTTQTEIQVGNNPSTSKVVTTTIIQNGDNAPQVSKKVYSSNNYGSVGNRRRFDSTQRFGDFKNNGVSSKYSKKVISSSSSTNHKYSGLVPSSQTVNISSKNKTKTTNQIISKAGASYNSSNNTYVSGKRQSGSSQYGGTKGIRSYSSASEQKDQYSYAGKVKETQNYMYYVSGIGYVTKEEADEANRIKKEKKAYQSKSVPKPIIRHDRIYIIIETKRPEKKGGKLVENYEYHETKEIKKKDRDTIVQHKSGDPFYQNILTDKKRFSSYTTGPRGYKSNYTLGQKDYSVDGEKTKTIEADYDKNYKYRNKTEENKGIFDTNKYKSSSTNRYQTYQSQTVSSAKESQSQNTLSNYRNIKNYGGSKYNSSSYQRTLDVDDNRKYGYGAKGKYGQNLTEGNVDRKSGITTTENIKKVETDYTKNRGTSGSNVRSISQGRQTQVTTTQEKRKYLPPTYKKYEEKTEESYRRGERKDYGQALNQKVFDTSKYSKYAKGKDDTSKYSRKTEESYKSGERKDYGQAVNQKVFDASKYSKYVKGKDDTSKYSRKTEESYKSGDKKDYGQAVNQKVFDASKYSKYVKGKDDTSSKYSRKTEEKKDYGQAINQKVFDASKYSKYVKGKDDTSKYSRKTEESYKKEEISGKYQKGGYNIPKYQPKTESSYQKSSLTEQKYQKYQKDQKGGYNTQQYQSKSGSAYRKDLSSSQQDNQKGLSNIQKYQTESGGAYRRDLSTGKQYQKGAQQYQTKAETSNQKYSLSGQKYQKGAYGAQKYQKGGDSYQKDSLTGQKYGKDAQKQGEYGDDAQKQGKLDYQQKGLEGLSLGQKYQQTGYGMDSKKGAASNKKYQKGGYGGESGAEYGTGAEAGVGEEYGVGAEAGAGAEYGEGVQYGAATGEDYGAAVGEDSGAGAGVQYGTGEGAGVEYGVGEGAGAEYGTGEGAGLEYGAGEGAGLEYGVGEGSGLEYGVGAGAGAEYGTGAGAGAEYGEGAGAGLEYGTGAGDGAGYEQSKYQQQNELDYQQEGLEGQDNIPQYQKDISRYPRGQEELYQQEEAQYSQYGKNICPIHGSGKKENQFGFSKTGGRTQENKYEYIHEQVNNALGESEEEPDNYKFYESKNITRKVENITTTNLNIRNMAGQDNLMRTGNVIGMSQEVQGTQGLLGIQGISSSQGIQGLSSSKGYETKVYIATKVTPVYSEIVNQNIQNILSGHVCNVCGNPIEQRQINSGQQIVYTTTNNTCPIHGAQQQYIGY